MDAGTDNYQICVLVSCEANHFFIWPAFSDVSGRASAVSARQLGHAVLDVTSQSSKSVETSLRKHHRNLFQVVANHVHSVKFSAGLVCQLSSYLRCSRGGGSKVCRQQHSIQPHLASIAFVFHKIMLRGTYRQYRA